MSEYKKGAIREELLKEMNIFLEHGGKVKVLPKEESCLRQVIGANGKYDAFEDFMNANFADFTEISNR